MKLSKVYEPTKHEKNIYDLWEKSGVFTPKNRGNDSNFSLVIPPPNANGDLHLGHGLTLAIEDIVVRYNRMKGCKTLMLPGADHAGFETQVVYEKMLAKQGKSRFDFSREELYKQIWEFVASNKDSYEIQLRKLGASLDWNRYVFTLDPKVVKRAYGTFKKMWDEGLIYRSERLVNFCTFHGTAFADIEVAYKEEPGHLWYIKYPLLDGSGGLTVATTRPETMLGDTAVAVNPQDKRYKHFVGKTVKLPLIGREIPVIADDYVDMAYGTGAVKITPAHDQNDFEIGERHSLPKVSVIDHEGNMSADAGEAYRGLKLEDARNKVVEDLKEQGLLVKTEEISHSVGHCYKCDTVIQPLLREQWFVDMKPLSKRAINTLKADKIKFFPAAKKTQLVRYLEGLRDWNISRQIAWGIPIPAFQNVDDPDDWIYDERVVEQEIIFNGKTYRRDPDVFDTWFSSGQWPYATLDYPSGKDFDDFYPLSLMETAADILYPWVSRMIMFGLYVTGEVPFKEVYLHGLIQDEHGAKMSKSKGNVIDPMTKVDQYGSDAFRMGIIADEAAGNNRPYDESKIIGARNFANKLWNIARYIQDVIENHSTGEPKPETEADHWVLTKLQHLTDGVGKDLQSYRFSDAYDKIYHMVWDDFADWYIEASKVSPNYNVLAYTFKTVLAVTHPFAPFVTEAIYQELFAGSYEDILAIAPWPKVPSADKKLSKDFDAIQNIVTEIRNLSTDLKLSKPVLDYGNSPLVQINAELIKNLSRAGKLRPSDEGKGYRLTGTKEPVWLVIDDSTLKAYAGELKSREEQQKAAVEHLVARLGNKNYVANAPKEIVEQTRQQLQEAKEQLAKLRTEIKRFS